MANGPHLFKERFELTVLSNGLLEELGLLSRLIATYGKTVLERGPGEVLLLTQKIKAGGKVYENGSRPTISVMRGDKMRFETGLELKLDDGRVRQGDAVTTYKGKEQARRK